MSSAAQTKIPLRKFSCPNGFPASSGHFKWLMGKEIKVQVYFPAKNILKPKHTRGLQILMMKISTVKNYTWTTSKQACSLTLFVPKTF